ncbi:hypothetical protein ACFVHW_35205 [Streptomyces sp. NPDC127110]|uniref:hypothetical protein n=1 Tax=Streptomyces sp. NPDC127110 TaxID=3345362 RepID=UPI003627718E
MPAADACAEDSPAGSPADPPADPPVLYEVRGPVAHVTMNGGTPAHDAHLPFERRARLRWDHTGRPGAESRFAREYRMPARRAYEVGMVNRVVPRADLARETDRPARRIAEMPGFGLALTKRALDQAEDPQGLHTGMDWVFGLHHLAHAHNAGTAADSPGGMNVAAMKEAAMKEAAMKEASTP